MIYRNYNELTEAVKKRSKKAAFAIVCAEEAHTIAACLSACEKGYFRPVFTGNAQEIKRLITEEGKHPEDYEILQVPDKETAVLTAIDMVHHGDVSGIMKGNLQTADLMKILLRSEHKLRTSSVVNAMSLMEIPGYHKLLAGSDPALCINPSIDDKIAIIKNSVAALQNIGIETPKVAMLSAIETPNPKMPDTLDAVTIKKMNQAGEISGCIIDGPLSYDLCLDKESSMIKGIQSEVAGDADLLIYPNLACGNAVSKALVFSAKAIGSSVILGTAVPVILPSRSSPIEEKERNILLASAIVR